MVVWQSGRPAFGSEFGLGFGFTLPVVGGSGCKDLTPPRLSGLSRTKFCLILKLINTFDNFDFR